MMVMVTAVPMAVGPACPASLLAQQLDQTEQRHDTVAGFLPLTLHVRSLREQIGAMQAQIDAHTTSAAADNITTAGSGTSAAWEESLRQAHETMIAISLEVERLRTHYSAAKHQRDLTITARLSTHVHRLQRSLDLLGDAKERHAAVTAITHIVAVLTAMQQTIADGAGTPRRKP